MKKVQIICGSVRPTRIGRNISQWVMEALPAESGMVAELIDLTDWPLPMDDEPGVPARDAYIHPHTQSWSRKVAEADAFVFVTPQYNWGYPASLKNALDHLFHEWAKKPAIIVSYGFHGGGKCAVQLREVLEGLRMRPVQTMPALVLPPEMKKGEIFDLELSTLRPAGQSVTKAWLELASLLSAPAGKSAACRSNPHP